MSKTVYHGGDVDREGLATMVRSLSYDIEAKWAHVKEVSTTQRVTAEDMESVTIEITVTPTDDSVAHGGFDIPFETDG